MKIDITTKQVPFVATYLWTQRNLAVYHHTESRRASTVEDAEWKQNDHATTTRYCTNERVLLIKILSFLRNRNVVLGASISMHARTLWLWVHCKRFDCIDISWSSPISSMTADGYPLHWKWLFHKMRKRNALWWYIFFELNNLIAFFAHSCKLDEYIKLCRDPIEKFADLFPIFIYYSSIALRSRLQYSESS